MLKEQWYKLLFFSFCQYPNETSVVRKLVLAVIFPNISFAVNIPRQILRIIKFWWCFSIYPHYHFSTYVPKIKYDQIPNEIFNVWIYFTQLFYTDTSTCQTTNENFKLPTVLLVVLINFNCYCDCLFNIFCCYVFFFAVYIHFVTSCHFMQTLYSLQLELLK